MTNKDLSRQVKLLGSLLELHGENSFRVKTYYNASFQLGKFPKPIAFLPPEEIAKLPGVGKTLAPKIQKALETGQFQDLDELIANTPGGVLEMLEIKGIGPSKIRAIWKDLNIDTVADLKTAAENNELSVLKGFGGKVQEKIIDSIKFIQANAGKVLFAEAQPAAKEILLALQNVNPNIQVSFTGQLLRKDDIIDVFEFLIGTENHTPYDIFHKTLDIPVTVKLYYSKPEHYNFQLLKTSSNRTHLEKLNATEADFLLTEHEIYQKNGLPYIIPEMRNGHNEYEWAKTYTEDDLIQTKHLKGAVHNHSTYSDGAHSLQQMAEASIKLGFEYFGIADHSKTAVYANGLSVDRVLQQQEEIDNLNKGFDNFKIIKGIESDILNDGNLDYDATTLSTFEYVVASVHAQLNMNEETATTRLIKAIENPATNILGHLTGRLLLRRNGYPVNYNKIIDCCIANKVAIEINANPWRLDIDWRHILNAQEKGAYFSINPDAHKTEGLTDMKYGVYSARKGGLISSRVINTFNTEKLLQFFHK